MITGITKEIIRERVQNAGIVGAGGAGFPTYVKFNSEAEIFLVNGAECEPLLKVDQQLAEKNAIELIKGLQYGMIATGAKEGIIALKAKYKPAIETLTPLLPHDIRIHILDDVYPAGDEVITIWMATGRRVPPAALPLSVGVVVNNVQTLINVSHAVENEAPVIDKTLTINGMVKTPITVTVPIGTTYRQVLEMAGGATIPNPAFLNGGPMMGVLFHDLDEPIKKTTGALLVLPDDHLLIRRRTQDMASVVAMARTVCEQCCLCTELCPRHLIGHELPPHLIVRAVNYQKADQTECSTILSALTCSECGICEAYACPVEISPMRLNQALKAQFRAEGAKYVGELRPLNPMAEYRLLPISRLITRIDLDRMNHKAPMIDIEWMPSKVVLPLLQHIGAPAKPVVSVGDRVTRGQLIASMEAGKLGVPLHASISGIIQNIDDHNIVIAQE